MSPSEFDLRAALREGEGDGLDPDSVIAAARAARHERRVRIGSALGAVAVVAGIGIGVGIADLQTSTRPTAAQPTGGSKITTSTPSAGTATRVAPAEPERRAAARQCPTMPDQLLLPGGGGTRQFGAGGPLFAQPVAAVRVCLYGSAVTAQPRSLVFSGSAARSLTTSLNRAQPSLGGRMCPDVMPDNQLTVELLAVTATGQDLPPVVAQTGCHGRSTNGTAVRYNWVPPTALARMFQIPPTK